MKNKLLLGACLLITAVLGWWAVGASEGSPDGLAPQGVGPSDERKGDAELVVPEGQGAEPRSEASAHRVAVEPEVDLEEDPDDPWSESLAGVTGRVVEADGRVVAGMSVALVEADGNLLVAADLVRLGEEPIELVLARTRTDEEGRFWLDGAYDAAYHALGIDLRGPRSTLRFVDTSVHHGEVTDLGDIVLREGCTVTGRVVDESGSPVGGVRVRLSPLAPDEAQALIPIGVQDFRADCAVGISAFVHSGEHSPVIEPPAMVRRHLDDLPFPTTTTDGDGRYRFEGAPVGKILFAIDQPGRLGLLRFDQTVPGEVELDEAVLRGGRTVAGEVFDVEGEPLAGVEVLAGAEVGGSAAILQPAGKTDAAGRFSVSGLPEEGQFMACARRAPGEPWIGVIGESSADMELEFETVFPVTVRLFDRSGEPVGGARVLLEPGHAEDSPMAWAEHFVVLGAERRPTRFREDEPGVYVCPDVSPGKYRVRAWPREHCETEAVVELEPDSPELELICELGEFLELAVRDGMTGEPIVGARARLVAQDDLLRARAVARSDRSGRARLGPVRDTRIEAGAGGLRDGLLVVAHPRYADTVLLAPPAVSVLDVEMVPGGELTGRITWGAGPPGEIYMLSLLKSDGESVATILWGPPRLARSGLDGSFRVGNLPAGTYLLQVYQRMFEEDPFDMDLENFQPVAVYRLQDVVIEAGRETDLTIDLGADGMAGMARLEGWVRLDGRPVEAASIRVYSGGGGGEASTDADGAYLTTPFLSDGEVNVRVQMTAENGKNRVLYSGKVEPQAGSIYRLDVDAASTEMRVRVVSRRDGAPVPGADLVAASVNGFGRESVGQTDDRGETSFALMWDGDCKLSVRSDGYVEAVHPVTFERGAGVVEVTVELSPAVPCRGICDLTRLGFADVEQFNLIVRLDDEGPHHWTALEREEFGADGRASFELDGLGPGSYTARVFNRGQGSQPVTFELREDGDSDLQLVFELAE